MVSPESQPVAGLLQTCFRIVLVRVAWVKMLFSRRHPVSIRWNASMHWARKHAEANTTDNAIKANSDDAMYQCNNAIRYMIA